MIFNIKEENAGVRLDKFLTEKITDKTRSKIQKLISSGLVLVDGDTTSVHHWLKKGEKVKVNFLSETKKLKVETSSKKLSGKKKTKKNFKIIFENEEFLVIVKPAGLIAHGAEHIKEEALSDLLLKKYPTLKNVGEGEERPGIVHRLDKDASGLMVVAKTQESFLNLKKQFKNRKTEKEYIALAHGQISKDVDKIDFQIKRSEEGNKQASIPKNYNGSKKGARSAITEFEVIKRFVNYTLVRVKIRTGRKHQIRVHFFAYGHPLVGDELYRTRRIKELNKKINLGRIFLVAVRLSFKDLAGKKYEFKVSLPRELKNFLKNTN